MVLHITTCFTKKDWILGETMLNSHNLDQGSRPFYLFPIMSLMILRKECQDVRQHVDQFSSTGWRIEISILPHHRYYKEYFSFTNVCQVFGFMQLLVSSVWKTVHNFAHWFLYNNIHYLSNCLQKCPISVNVLVCYLPTFPRRYQKKVTQIYRWELRSSKCWFIPKESPLWRKKTFGGS